MQSRSPNARPPQSYQLINSTNAHRRSPTKLTPREETFEPKPNRTIGEARRLNSDVSIPSDSRALRLRARSPNNESQQTVQRNGLPKTESEREGCNTSLVSQLRRSPKPAEDRVMDRLTSPTSPRKPMLPSKSISFAKQRSCQNFNLDVTKRMEKQYSVKEMAESALETTQTSSIETDFEYTTTSLLRDCSISGKKQSNSMLFKKKPNLANRLETSTTRTFKQDHQARIEQPNLLEQLISTSPTKKQPDFRQTCLGRNTSPNNLDKNVIDFLIKQMQSDRRKHSLNFNIAISTDANDPQIKLSDFNFGKCIGNGKFGQVYQARHRKTGTLVAIKKICKYTIKQYKMEKQIIEQIKLQAFCINPNILQLYGYFHDELHVYLILEYATDGTLFNYLHKHSSKLAQKEAAPIIKEVIFAVHFLHENDIAHRDIKPENILLSSGIAKLCDFGWSARVLETRKSYCGTFDYTPPEILQRKEYDKSVDLWCLGVLVYELLTGKVPFSSNDRKISINKIINVDKEKISYPCELSTSAKNVIEGLLRKNPKERFRPKELLAHQFFRINTR